jgi:AmiR/NasT family two-component response regulator
MLFIGLTFAGLVVIAVCAVKVFAAVRDLGRELQHTRDRLEPEHSALRAAARRLEGAGK